MENIVYTLLETSGEYTCGNTELTFSGAVPNAIHIIVLGIEIVVPILLIIFGLIDMAKAVMSQKEDEIKKGQQTLIKRFIAAIIVFFVVFLVKTVVKFVSGDNSADIVNCLDCFLNASDEKCTVAGDSGGDGTSGGSASKLGKKPNVGPVPLPE